MTDKFGRSSLKHGSNIHRQLQRGPPGSGFKLTDDGNYDMDGKRLCNIAEPQADGDAINFTYFVTKFAHELIGINRFISNHMIAIKSVVDETLNAFKEQHLLDYKKDIVGDVSTLSRVVSANAGAIELLQQKFKMLEAHHIDPKPTTLKQIPKPLKQPERPKPKAGVRAKNIV